MNKQNLKLYSQATWDVLIRNPALAIWKERETLAILFGAIGLFIGISWLLVIWTESWIYEAIGLSKVDIWPEPMLLMALIVEWIGLLVLFAIIISIGESLVTAIKARADEITGAKKPRRKRKAAAE